MRSAVLAAATAVTTAALVLGDPVIARACGCLSPPVPPAIGEADYAVNQQAEQIIFEVEPGWVTAHVLIKYAGDPASFAWIVPVPEVPELAISPVSAFGVIDQSTAPAVSVRLDDLCPISQWACAYHEQPSCGLFDSADGAGNGGAGLADAGAGTGTDPVTVIDQQVVGDYQTVTFRASEAAAATQWLRDNGFIVNQTTSIYMESYVQQNMVFVAAKLVAGAGISAIKPLRMRYRAAYPTVPLILTAVAAEPHLTVTTFIYGNEPYQPQGHPVVTVDPERIALDPKGRVNYPMVLARTIDEAGGDGFAIEYRGAPVQPQVGQGSFCCSNEFDSCGLGGDGQCQCPGSEFDNGDCASQGDLVEGISLVRDLATRYSHLTRITTRVSAEEMTFDPAFEPHYGASQFGRLSINTSQPSLARCAGAVVDKEAYAQIDAEQLCAATYCGEGGRCVVTTSGPACACDTGFVAQRFNDLDGAPSVTCIPKTPPVDLRAEGLQLPNACANVSCGNSGTCIDRNGVAVCECATGTAAALSGVSTPRCESIVFTTSTPGAQDYSDALVGLDVCAPPPPTCGADGWLIKTKSPRPGVECGGDEPAFSSLVPPPRPTCGPLGCGGCQAPGDEAPFATLGGGLLVGLVLMRRRRTGRAGQVRA